MTVMPRKQGDPATPFKDKFDYMGLKFDQSKLDAVIKRMKERYRTEERKEDVTALVNPCLNTSRNPMYLNKKFFTTFTRGGRIMETIRYTLWTC